MNTSLERLIGMITRGGTSEQVFTKILPDIRESNRIAVRNFSILAFVMLLGMTAASYFVESIKEVRPLYMTSAAACGVIALLSATLAKKSEVLKDAVMYAFMAVLLLFGIFLGTVVVRDEITATYIAMILTAPLVFTDRPFRMHIVLILSTMMFCIMTVELKEEQFASTDVVNGIVFGLLSMVVSTYMMFIKIQRYAMEEKVRFMAENDQLTGLRNRNSYEQEIVNSKILEANSLYCVYVDVNGLHELNNTQGHEAGDRMLQFVAKLMQNIFGEDNTYRIGGDEYVALGKDKTEEEVREQIAKLKTSVEAAGYHVAAGMDHKPGKKLVVNDLIKTAEHEMYLDKAAYYRQNGNDRRHYI